MSGAFERAHYAFVVATGAAALGRHVVVFATNAGCRALLADWSGLDDAGRDERLRTAGIAGFDELRDAARELSVRLIACEAGLRAEALDSGALWSGVEVGGIATFLSEIDGGQIVTL